MEEEKSKLDRLEDRLYNAKVEAPGVIVHDMRSHHATAIPTTWGDNQGILVKAEVEKKVSFGLKFLLLSLVFFVAVGGYSAWRVMSSKNVVSADKIDLISDMKPYVEGGEEIPLAVSINNRNTIALEEATLTLSYEKGVGSEDEQKKVFDKKTLGTVVPNQLQKINFPVVLYGEEASSRDIVVKLEYKVSGSNALFSKVVTTVTVLKTPPVSVHIDGPETLSQGQIGTYTIVLRNNTSTSSVPSRLALIAPESFVRQSATPPLAGRDTGWNLEPLAPGESQTFTVRGSFKGVSGQVSTLKVLAGSGSGKGSNDISIVYTSDKKEVTVRNSPLVVTLRGESDRGIGDTFKFGDRAMVVVSYENQSSETIRNVELRAELSGDGLNYEGVLSDDGYYDSAKKTILWNKATQEILANIPPNGRGDFRMYLPIISKGKSNPTFTVDLYGTADSKEIGDVSTNVSKTYAIQGSASLNAWTAFKDSPFPGTGPIPPVVNTQTAYTVHLIASAQNTLSGTKVSFILPIYVTWTGTFTPDKIISYNPSTRTVVWDIGSLSPSAAQIADVQVLVKPSQSHVGTSPTITSGLTLEGQEMESRARIKTTLTPLTTEISREGMGDDAYKVIEK